MTTDTNPSSKLSAADELNEASFNLGKGLGVLSRHYEVNPSKASEIYQLILNYIPLEEIELHMKKRIK